MSESPLHLSIPEAAKLSGVTTSKFRRRMYALNDVSDGRLLVRATPDKGQKVGKWLVCLAVLEEVAPARAKTRPATVGELSELEDTVRRLVVDVRELKERTNAHKVRLGRHGERLTKLDSGGTPSRKRPRRKQASAKTII